MNRRVLCAMIILALGVASTTDAATLWMQFEGGGNTITVMPSSYVNVEVWIDLLNGDSLSGLGQPYWPGDSTGIEGLEQTSVIPYPGWGENSLDGVVGMYAQQDINVFAPGPGQVIYGPGSYLLAVMTLHQNGICNDDSLLYPEFYPIMFGGDPTVTSALLDAVGHEIPFWPANAVYSGYYTWGQGSCAISGKNGNLTYDDPLKVYCPVPEPASMCLLVLGGGWILRRRCPKEDRRRLFRSAGSVQLTGRQGTYDYPLSGHSCNQ